MEPTFSNSKNFLRYLFAYLCVVLLCYHTSAKSKCAKLSKKFQVQWVATSVFLIPEPEDLFD